MKALEFRRSEPRYVAAAVASRFRPGSGASVSPLQLTTIDPPDLPGVGWERITTLLSGICGSDLSAVSGATSRYFEPWISFPFVPGHEVIGRRADGTRVVVETVLGHEARGAEPPFEGAAPGDGNDYRHLVTGPMEPGIQIGYCADTGGGWSEEFVAHRSQLHEIPADMSDEAAVMIEPTAVGVHAAAKAAPTDGATVAIIGAGTQGLVALAAVRAFTPAGTIITAAKHPEQKALARDLGADIVCDPAEIRRAVRRVTGCFAIGDDLSGGVDVVIDAVGSANSVGTAIGIARPRGRVVMVGMAGQISLDTTAMWHRETELVGAYTYGTDTLPDGTTARTFHLAIELAAKADLGRLVTATYPLERYVDALDHAANAGRRGAIKICFDLRR